MKIFFIISCSGKSTLIKTINKDNCIIFENVIDRIIRADKDFLLDFLYKYKSYSKEIIFLENSLIYDTALMKKLSEIADLYFIDFTKDQYNELFKRKESRNTERLSYKNRDYAIRSAFNPTYCKVISYNENLINTIKDYI